MPEKCHRLLDSEKTYLETGTAPGSYRPHEMERRVSEKVELLPLRFEHLCEDVELLERRFQEEPNLLDTEIGFHAWLEFLGLEESATRQEVNEALTFENGERGSALADFGSELGKTVDSLMRWPKFDDVTNEDIVAELVWGFLRGLQFDRRLAGNLTEEKVQNDVGEILSRVEERGDGFAERCSSRGQPTEWDIRWKVRNYKIDEMATHVQDLLTGDRIPNCELATEIAERTEETENEANGFSREVVEHIMVSALGEDHTIESRELHGSFWERYGPAEEFVTEKFVTKSKVHSVIEERRLDEKYELERELEREAEALADKGRMGVSADDVLPMIVEDGSLSSRKIAAQVDDSRDYTASVTRLAKDLAGDETGSTQDAVEIWTDRPLLTGDREGWEATEYGKAAAYALKKHIAQKESHPILTPLEVQPFPQDLLSRALSEVTGSQDR
ncbi:MAG: hypothetical protein R6V31_08630 [Halohasta sp.]